MFRRAGWILFIVLLGAVVVAWSVTEGAVSTAGFPASAQSHSTVPAAERPLAIARAMSGLSDTPVETQLASQTQQLAQQLVDASIRQEVAAAEATGVSHKGPLWQRVQTVQAALDQEQATASALTGKLQHASAATRPGLEAQLQLTNAQMALDSARQADAKEDLSRATPEAATPGDVAAMQKAAVNVAETAARRWRTQWQQQAASRNPASAQGLAALITAWRRLAAKETSLSWAHTQAAAAAAAAQASHNQLHAQLAAAEAQNGRRMSGAMGQLQKGAMTGAAAQALAARAQQLAAGQRRLIGFDHAAQYEGELAQVYGHWASIGQAQEELALHDALTMLLEILIGIAVLILLDRLIGHTLARTRAERRRLHTLRHVLRFGLEVVGLIWVLLTLVGSPAQWLTFLGLAGAGLTVALQDTILSFFGWFVLIGRRGLAPGDWVEINHISGEVVEITLLQTTMQEAGNWTEPGHPTGRRVLFPNSFVFTGPYLKFSTRGQWLWDEIRVPLTEGATIPDLAAVGKLVEQETRADAERAAKEWEAHGRGAARPEPDPLSFAPAVQIKPGQEEAMDLCIRYITNAAGRAERRERLYHRIYQTRTANAG
ncbi:MAG: mechanosensitive ion channel domain-containing protein [Terriglobales bacterium]